MIDDYIIGHWTNRYQAQSLPHHFSSVETIWEKVDGGYHSKNFKLDASSETLLIDGDPDLIAEYITRNLEIRMPGLQQMRRELVDRFLHNNVEGAVID